GAAPPGAARLLSQHNEPGPTACLSAQRMDAGRHAGASSTGDRRAKPVGRRGLFEASGVVSRVHPRPCRATRGRTPPERGSTPGARGGLGRAARVPFTAPVAAERGALRRQIAANRRGTLETVTGGGGRASHRFKTIEPCPAF